jgi:hypothetical protein
MAKVTFDGPNKLIIVNPGITSLDVKQDLYSDWKEWVLGFAGSPPIGNAQYLPAFSVIGGEPTGPGTYAGVTFFVTNGWKIRPYEGNHTLVLDGNIVGEGGVNFIQPTVGSYNVVVQFVFSSLAQGIEVSGGGGSSSVYIGDTPPSNPVPGDLWWNSSTGLMMIYYNDGNSSQWVIANPTGGGGGDCPTAEEIRLEMESSGNMLSNIYTQTSNIEIIVTDIQNTLATGFPTLGNIADAVWEAALASYVTSGSAGFIVSTILTQVTDINDDTNHIRPIIDNIELLAEEILKYDRNRTRIDKAAKTLTVYDDDEVTPIRVFNLLDGTGTPSVTEVLERDPI